MAVGSSNDFDLVVLGAGTGGYAAAFRAAQLGLKVALVDEDIAYDPPQGARSIGSNAFETALIHRFRCFDEDLSDLQVLGSEDGFRASAEFNALIGGRNELEHWSRLDAMGQMTDADRMACARAVNRALDSGVSSRSMSTPASLES